MAHPSAPQLQMIRSKNSSAALLSTSCPPGYSLRLYQPGDEARFYELMTLAGWPDWNDEGLRPWLYRLLPGGWFFAIHDQSRQIVAAAMATHDPTWRLPFSGEVGWVATDPAHTGQGLGTAVVSAVTNRFIEIGYLHIHLYTEHYRLPAIKIYLKLGFVPYLYSDEMPPIWKKVCTQLSWPYTPDIWKKESSSWHLD